MFNLFCGFYLLNNHFKKFKQTCMRVLKPQLVNWINNYSINMTEMLKFENIMYKETNLPSVQIVTQIVPFRL